MFSDIEIYWICITRLFWKMKIPQTILPKQYNVSKMRLSLALLRISESSLQYSEYKIQMSESGIL